MKKNLTSKKLFAATLACVALMSLSVIAQEVTTIDVEQPDLISSNETVEAVQEAPYTVYSGTVSGVTENQDGSVRVTIDGDMGVIANLQPETFVISADEPTLEGMSISDIKVGMDVSFVIPKYSPMTLSLPPQTSSVKVVVIGGENLSFNISTFNEDLISEELSLKLNIDEKTKIVDIRGAKEGLTAEDVKNSQSIVFYTFTTFSIPAQTAPDLIFILDNEAIGELTLAEETYEPALTEVVAELVALRAKATDLGFTLEWTSNSEPITLSKEDSTIQVKIGSSSYTINGEEKELLLVTELKDGKTFVSNEIFK